MLRNRMQGGYMTSSGGGGNAPTEVVTISTEEKRLRDKLHTILRVRHDLMECIAPTELCPGCFVEFQTWLKPKVAV